MSKSLDRLTLLQTFVRIAEAGSISAAARDLGLSQPSASRQLAELESRFQVQLMQRTTHHLSLTPAGAEFLRDARRLLDGWEALAEKHAETEAALRGSLKVVVPVALGQLYLADVAFRFQKQHPRLLLSWQLEDDDIRFAEVGCDCWIKIGTVTDRSLTVESLGQVERLAVAAPELLETYGSPRSPRDVEDLPWVALAPFEGGHISLSQQSGKSVDVAPLVRLTTNNIYALYRAAIAGIGVAILPRWFIEKDLEAGRLIDLLPRWRAPTLPVQVASLSKSYRPRRLTSFLEILKETVPTLPGIEKPT